MLQRKTAFSSIRADIIRIGMRGNPAAEYAISPAVRCLSTAMTES